ncbi:MAG: cell surface protein SprA [Flavobacteriales bacterium]|nr:cell surface protein SprA [Flavobacteriales bacterium]
MNFLKYNIFLFLSFLFLSLIALGQNENLLYPDWPYNLSNVVDSVQYDHNTETILITNYVGGQPISTPRYFSQSEYQQYLFNQNFYNYWKERIDLSNSNTESGKIGLSDQISNRIFGGSLVDIKPQGSAELVFSGVINKIDNPALPEAQRKTTSFNFDERIQMNVIGRIGNKLQLQANYDTEATFEFENEIKLEYSGDEDDIVKKIELGNVSLPLSGSLVTGAQSLFGVKTKLQFGKTTLTTVFSEQKSETSSIEIQGGAQMTEFELSIDNYEENKHFFLAQYFYEAYDQAMNPELLPIISSAVNITRIEVYVTNKNSTTINTRNILALQDL